MLQNRTDGVLADLASLVAFAAVAVAAVATTHVNCPATTGYGR